jgi:hypothetical protein
MKNKITLPETWVLKVTSELYNYIEKYRKLKSINDLWYRNYDYIKNNGYGINYHENKEVITTERFIQYMNRLEQKSDVILSTFINEVQSSEGGIYKIGDIVSSIKKPDIPGIIEEFKWNEDQTHILVKLSTRDKHIGLNYLQIHVEPEFVLPERWCIKNTNNIIGQYFENLTGRNKVYTQSNINCYLHNKYTNGRDIQLYLNGNLASTFIRNSFTEITFEQFKKYILKQ